MTVRNLEFLFKPTSVAVIGASRQPGSVGNVVVRNLLAAGFGGPIMPVNPKHESVAGILAYPSVGVLPRVPDLAVICTPAATVPGLIAEVGDRGTKATVVLSAGLAATMEGGGSYRQAALDAAKPHLLRILGPNCIGIAVPSIGLDATFAHVAPLPGRLAFVSQSGALCTAVLDWARAKGIGFSHVVSLGDSADVDFGDVLDYLAGEPDVDAILLYIESIAAARKFMSAARAAARNKPVVAVKAGRAPEAAQAAFSHTGTLAGSDAIVDAALRRAGILRVHELGELFGAVETLANARMPKGDRMAIITNGGGPGVMATDTLIAAGGHLATLSDGVRKRLDAMLPAGWSGSNPIDIFGDAPPERYRAALEAVFSSPDVDAVLVINAPTAIASGLACAKTVAYVAAASKRCVLTAWIGSETAAEARRVFAEAHIPTYETPERAVHAFRHVRAYQTTRAMLMETPPALTPSERPAAARAIVERALAEGRTSLSERQAKTLLASYRIPVVPTHVAQDPTDAAKQAQSVGGSVALKIASPDISHKSDVGGVVLDLASPQAVKDAAIAMLDRVKRMAPTARLEGFTIQPMARRAHAFELIVGLAADPVFGPAVLFGHGGTAVEIVADRAVGLPPLNLNLAREMIGRTRIARQLGGYRDRPAVDLDAVATTLVRLADMAIDLPEIAELDVNPLLADETGVLVLDARVRLDKNHTRPAIRPYPRDLQEEATVKDRRVVLRPIRPEDEPAHRRFFETLSPEDIRFRFFGLVREMPHSQLARFTQIDYDREMAFIASAEEPGREPETLGVARAVCDPDNVRAEFAIIVRADVKGAGLGRMLLEKLLRYLRARGVAEVVGQTLPDNQAMLALATELGFAANRLPGCETVELVLDLRDQD
ncbi:MAG: bifunctional acetate--CoA ligase family protein/GNAT family N-acetyltransferase [Alphaproteobacteria bacterium]